MEEKSPKTRGGEIKVEDQKMRRLICLSRFTFTFVTQSGLNETSHLDERVSPDLTSALCLRPAAVDRKPPELSTLTDGYQIRIWPRRRHRPALVRRRRRKRHRSRQEADEPGSAVASASVDLENLQFFQTRRCYYIYRCNLKSDVWQVR